MTERILLVEDNKALGKVVAKKIESELPFEVDTAFNLAEAQLFMRKNNYFLALLDINLPDAPNGEIVDIALEKGIPSIVLSGNVDKNFREMMLQKEIIDYIGKGGIEDINYTIDIIKRLSKNRNYKVMLVDDSMVFRKQMQKMLEHLFFKVFAVAHGEEALNMLEQNPDIKVILTDYNMPVINGLELTKEVRKKYTKQQLAIFVMSSQDASDVSAMFLKNGANDYLHKPFSKEEISVRVNNAIEALENIQSLTHYAHRDFLTGLYTREHFLDKMQGYHKLSQDRDEPYALAMIDIDNFGSINQQYGNDAGDEVIIYLSDILRSNSPQDNIIARFSGASCCMLIKNTYHDQALELIQMIQDKISRSILELDNGTNLSFTVSIGLNTHPEDNIADTLDQTDMLLFNAKQKGTNQLNY